MHYLTSDPACLKLYLTPWTLILCLIAVILSLIDHLTLA